MNLDEAFHVRTIVLLGSLDPADAWTPAVRLAGKKGGRQLR